MTRDLLSRDEMFRAEACRALDEACRDAGVGTVSTAHGFTPCACIRHPDVFVESSWRPDSPAPRYRARLGGMVCQWTMSATEAHADALRLLSEVEARDRAVAEHAKRRRQATVRALRAAADAIERGAHESQIACEPMALSYDGIETFSALGEAEAWTEDMIEPDDGEYHPDVEQVSWGIYVAVERAHVVVDETPELAAMAREHGYDEHWSVSLVDAWEDGMVRHGHGCCADKVCDHSTCMALPEGKSCAGCEHLRRCVSMFGAQPSDTSCQFFPRRFRHVEETNDV